MPSKSHTQLDARLSLITVTSTTTTTPSNIQYKHGVCLTAAASQIISLLVLIKVDKKQATIGLHAHCTSEEYSLHAPAQHPLDSESILVDGYKAKADYKVHCRLTIQNKFICVPPSLIIPLKASTRCC